MCSPEKSNVAFVAAVLFPEKDAIKAEKLQREKRREAERNAKLSAQSAADKKKALLADILSRVKK